ncbi:MAG TPA: nicotinate-nucleotide--dimethylbenzimidazole phosphoribosyltransferase [Myxococcota bacterium]|nr:nicotinate-nucleotide--dimethylbenzimidazole phosphoribosyltransferase [Myxococcota bacterium]HON25275.1 nicotinate-nucleotide--dimethylbenzimidazole phosphoribosyltransferase [Myxococcota bacterium]HOS62459.1 nicotinate-nucleotide--dimethylbenzimidazole phosphoribosyltransferase [Myxococcota bacterium]HPC90842.1 nicotinate-nucleotide--dimethylbenzimidazole phosphoribosyltransferase [Myxococcota bacterium]HPL25575.1 nicotinate-nucleotide--dimethylbenzimidazole phosphoribosyltransferase [Myxo
MIRQELQRKIDTRTKPLGSLGKLEELALKIGIIQNTSTPELRKPAILTFAADHGIVDEGVSAYSKEVTWQMVMNFVQGGAGINVFTRQHGIHLRVIDAGVDYDFPEGINVENHKLARGTQNMMHAPAMSIELCQKAIETGAQCVQEEFNRGCNVIGFGEMGIGNTSSASLLLHKIAGIPLRDCVGPGTGLTADGMERKCRILSQVAEKYDPKTPIETLATFGGIEIAMICGGVIEARRLNMTILADGFIATSGFLAAYNMQPDVLDNVIYCHSSNEPGHRHMLEYMKADPILHLDLRLGEGTGVAVAYPILESAVNFLNQMASFDEAEVCDEQIDRKHEAGI